MVVNSGIPSKKLNSYMLRYTHFHMDIRGSTLALHHRKKIPSHVVLISISHLLRVKPSRVIFLHYDIENSPKCLSSNVFIKMMKKLDD